jgi:hypothetical protein
MIHNAFMSDVLSKFSSIPKVAASSIANLAIKSPCFSVASWMTVVLLGFQKQYKVKQNYQLQLAFEKKYPLFYKILESYKFTNAITGNNGVKLSINQIQAINDKNEKTPESVLLKNILSQEKNYMTYEVGDNKIIKTIASITKEIIDDKNEFYNQLKEAIKNGNTKAIKNIQNQTLEKKIVEFNEEDSNMIKESSQERIKLSCCQDGMLIKDKIFDQKELEEVESDLQHATIIDIANNREYSKKRKLELAQEEENIRKVLLHLEKKYKCLPFLNLILACYNYGAGMGMIYEKGSLLLSNLLFIYAFLSYFQLSKGIIAGALSSTAGISSILLWVLENRLFYKYYEEIHQDKEEKKDE